MSTFTLNAARKPLFAALCWFVASTCAVAADLKPAPAGVTAEQIVAKNLAARGGLEAWQAVRALTLNGTLDAGLTGEERNRRVQAVGKGHGERANVSAEAVPAKAEADKQVQLPITLEMKQPDKSRVEVEFAGKTAVQVFDGKNGWKLRPYLNRDDVVPFTKDEARFEAARGGLEGPLINYAARGSKVQLEGVEPVEGSDAYKLKVTSKSGDVQHVWIDAKTFLDVKLDGIPREMDGKMHNVWIYQRDFRAVHGVKIPFVLESAVDGYPDTHKLVVEKAEINPQLDDALFAKPKA